MMYIQFHHEHIQYKVHTLVGRYHAHCQLPIQLTSVVTMVGLPEQRKHWLLQQRLRGQEWMLPHHMPQTADTNAAYPWPQQDQAHDHTGTCNSSHEFAKACYSDPKSHSSLYVFYPHLQLLRRSRGPERSTRLPLVHVFHFSIAGMISTPAPCRSLSDKPRETLVVPPTSSRIQRRDSDTDWFCC